jgi:GNAT superfamily N-acetyltransferase
MNCKVTSTLDDTQKAQIYDLWNREYPANIGYDAISDFDVYLGELSEQTHYLVTNGSDQIVGWMFTFVRDGAFWFAIIIDSSAQGKGLGTQLLNKIKIGSRQLNGWTIDHYNDMKKDGSPYRSALPFYLKNDFTVCPDTRLNTEKVTAVRITWQFKS